MSDGRTDPLASELVEGTLGDGPPTSRASRWRTLSIAVRSILVTLAISIPTIWESRRGTSARANADRRLRWWSAKLLSFVDLRLRVSNPHAVTIPEGRPVILMCNHASLYDIPLTLLAFPGGSIRMLTKRELFRVPIWGRALAAAEFVSIDRRERKQALRDLDAAREKMTDGIVLWIAPEGTRSRTGELLPFKKGGFMLALQTGATIVPFAIRGAREVLPAKTLRFRLGATAEVRIGRPIDASTHTLETRNALTAEVEAAIRALLA